MFLPIQTAQPKVPARSGRQAKALVFLQTRPNKPLAKTVIAGGAGLTIRQTGKALQTFLADGRVTTSAESGKERFAFTSGPKA